MEQKLPSNIPQISLPPTWNQAYHREPQCEVCHWSGDPEGLYKLDRRLEPTFGEASGMKNCIRCRILSLAITQTPNLREGGICPSQNDVVYISNYTMWPIEWHIWFEGGANGGDINLFTPRECAQDEVPRGIAQMSTLQHMNNTNSKDSFVWAKDQIESHLDCCQPSNMDNPSFIPTRLINVSRLEQGVILEENVSEGSQYVALSYCWGEGRTCQTTNNTLLNHKQQIPWSDLPKTIQDAVEVTRQLNIQYLWVDRLCIIQGNKDDWDKESGRMFDVYRHSYVTLAGVWGPESESGLFHSPKKEFRPTLLAELRLNNRYWPLYMRQRHLEYYMWIQSAGPLFTRAWTYQERLIPPRVLFFGGNELSFECFCSAACQCGYTQHQFSEDKSHTWSLDRGHRIMFFEDVINGSEYDPSQLWRSMVSRYSEFKLTNHSDKLPAIGAVAQQFQNVFSDEQYLAGLWSGSLHMGLLWHVLGGVKKISTGVPTWSWASMFEGWILWSRALRPYDFTSTMEVIRATCHYGAHNSFGVPKESQLILRGPLLQCWASKKVNSDGIVYSWLKTARARSKHKSISKRRLKPIRRLNPTRKLRLEPRIKSALAGAAPNPTISDQSPEPKRKSRLEPKDISVRAAAAPREAIDDHAWLSVPRRKQPKTVYLFEVARNDVEDEDEDEDDDMCNNSIYFLVLRRKGRTYDETRRVFTRVGVFCVDSQFGYKRQDARYMRAVLKTRGKTETIALA
ncbi:heterokaryon incompatibility protein-domain-containing protein [Annulohypoxylon stygium]|nr:heterokaryon incompatibility protein-domain-containing protein [Annulohypoxylon stygium]